MFVTVLNGVFVTVTVHNDSVAESDQDQGMVQRVATGPRSWHWAMTANGTVGHSQRQVIKK